MAGLNIGIAAAIACLADLDTHALRQQWTELYGAAPAPRISRDILIRGVAWRLQENATGGLSKSCVRQLRRLANELGDGKSVAATQDRSFKPGTKLIREWKGNVHEVVVADETYIWSGNHYRSLTQIARLITGTRWSGPRFFGLETAQRATAGSKVACASLGATSDG